MKFEELDKDIEKKQKLLNEKKEHFKDYISFQGRRYLLEEYHGEEAIIGKYCIGLEIRGVNHKAQIFVIGVRNYDNGQYEEVIKDEITGEKGTVDVKNIKRPAIFSTATECRQFMEELYFPKAPLKGIKITREIYLRDMFPTIGAYLVTKSAIALV